MCLLAEIRDLGPPWQRTEIWDPVFSENGVAVAGIRGLSYFSSSGEARNDRVPNVGVTGRFEREAAIA